MEENAEIRLDEINWRVVLKDLVRNAWLFVLAYGIAVMGVGVYKNIVYTPEYTTSATMAVTVRGDANSSLYYSLSTANEIAEVYATILQEKITREKISEVVDTITDDIRISASVIPETNLLVLKVTGATSKGSYLAMQDILKNYHIVSDYIFGNAVVEVIMEPRVPFGPSNTLYTSRMKKLAAAVLIGLMGGLIVLSSVLRDTVKTTKAAKRRLEGECLAVFPHEEKNRTWKARIRQYYKGILLTSRLISFRFEESCHQLSSRLAYKLNKTGKKMVLVTSVAENEGKSTVAVNLAIALARRNKKVVIIDLDLLKPALYKLLESNPAEDHSLSDYLDGKAKKEDILFYDKVSGLYAVLNVKGVRQNKKYLNSERLQQLLEACKNEFDYVILDTAPMFSGTDAERLSEFVDTSILVARQDRVSISDLNDAMESLKESSSQFLGYVLNDFDESTGGRSGYGYGYGYGYGKRSGKAAVESKQ